MTTPPYATRRRFTHNSYPQGIRAESPRQTAAAHISNRSNYTCVSRHPQHVHRLIHTAVWPIPHLVVRSNRPRQCANTYRGLTDQTLTERRLP